MPGLQLLPFLNYYGKTNEEGKITPPTPRLGLKTQQRFKSERHNVFTKDINKVALRSNDAKRMQSIDSIETYGYGRSKVKKKRLNVTI